MGDVGEVTGEEYRYGVFTVYGVKGGVSDGTTFGGRELCIDGGNVEGDGGVPPLGVPEDSRNFRSASQVGGMGVVICGWCLGGGGAVSNEGVHSEAAGYHFRVYLQSPHI